MTGQYNKVTFFLNEQTYSKLNYNLINFTWGASPFWVTERLGWSVGIFLAMVGQLVSWSVGDFY
jgi:hypothetical protein